MAASKMGETPHSEEAFDTWESDSWRLPDGVLAAFGGANRITMHVDGRRVPVVGDFKRNQSGEVQVVPKNKNGRRGEDRDLLEGVADLVGLDAAIPGAGRPKGEGIGRRAAWWIANRPPQMTFSAAVESAAQQMGWDTDSVQREFYFHGGDRLRDQPAP